jgi:hypothetical protein
MNRIRDKFYTYNLHAGTVQLEVKPAIPEIRSSLSFLYFRSLAGSQRQTARTAALLTAKFLLIYVQRHWVLNSTKKYVEWEMEGVSCFFHRIDAQISRLSEFEDMGPSDVCPVTMHR